MKCLEERLNREKHFEITGNFMCGPDDPLNLFLSDESFEYDEEKYGSTYLLLDVEHNTLIGFYTIKTNGIQVRDCDNHEHISVPVIEVARIAVEYEFQNNGFGKIMFHDYILPKVKSVETQVAVKAIIVFVEPDNSQGISFYESLGFEKASSNVHKMIIETFNEDCDLYVLEL